MAINDDYGWALVRAKKSAIVGEQLQAALPSGGKPHAVSMVRSSE
jgi:hypothetical protein